MSHTSNKHTQTTIPHEVVGLMIEKNISPMAAWLNTEAYRKFNWPKN